MPELKAQHLEFVTWISSHSVTVEGLNETPVTQLNGGASLGPPAAKLYCLMGPILGFARDAVLL